jgi:predicted O-linked N-acetylglucosamine transferase (SPINDLY family)
VQSNLQAEAKSRGITPERLCFAPRSALATHLERMPLADLFLDTAPYNAHTTASDALWVGLPVLTCPGQTFASRVGASLVAAAGLPELIAPDWHSYEQSALTLARRPEMLRGLRQRLRTHRATCALFDTPRLAHALETAFEAMYRRHQSGA